MRILLDTHLLLWLLYEPENIGKQAKSTLKSADVIYVSIVSIWELAIKFSKKRLVYSPDELVRGARSAGFQDLPLRTASVINLPAIKLGHKDPFDQLLVSQAETEGCTFLTADRVILQSPYQTIDANL